MVVKASQRMRFVQRRFRNCPWTRLEYCAPVWNPYKITHGQFIKMIQGRAPIDLLKVITIRPLLWPSVVTECDRDVTFSNLGIIVLSKGRFKLRLVCFYEFCFRYQLNSVPYDQHIMMPIGKGVISHPHSNNHCIARTYTVFIYLQ